MIRTKSLKAIENEIAQTSEVMFKTKAKHEAAIANLEAVMTRKDEFIARELLEAFKESGKSYYVMMRFLEEGLR
jgi:16S rRNA C1402 (ribose-2'-O) methylase RsmI